MQGFWPGFPARSGEAAYDYVDFWFLNGKEAGPLTYQPEAEEHQPASGAASASVTQLRWRCKMCSDFLGAGMKVADITSRNGFTNVEKIWEDDFLLEIAILWF